MKYVQWKLSCSMWTDRQTDRYMSGWTGRHDKANSNFMQICECA